MSDATGNDQNPEDEQPEVDPKTEQQQRAGLDFLVSVADTRIQLYFEQNWPAMMEEVAAAVAKKIDPEQIAARAEKIFETRWNEAAVKRQAADAGGDGGENGSRPTASGAGGGGNDDLGFLSNVPEGDASNHPNPAAPHATDPKQALAIAGMRFLEDPVGQLKQGIDLIFDVVDRRRPKPPVRNDLDLIEDLAKRRQYLVDLFASPDPMSAPDRIADAMYAGANSGMRVAEAMARHNIRDATRRPAPRFKPPKVEAEPATPTPAPTPEPTPAPAPTPTPEPVAPMAQERPARRRRRLQDAV